MDNLRAFSGILASDRQIYFEVGGIPELSRGNQRPAVPNYAGVDGKRFPCTDDVKIVENVGAQALASKEARTVVARAGRCRRKRSPRVIGGDSALTNRKCARCSRVGSGIVKDDIHELGFLIRIARNECAAFAVDSALAVAGHDRGEMRCNDASVF